MAPERMTELASLVGSPASARRNPRKLSHLIERDLRGLILRGVLAPNQMLPSETDLMQAFQVSRNTLREALRILESESLIEMRRGRAGGAVVRRPHPGSVARYVSLLLQVRSATVSDVQDVRLVVEPAGAARLAEDGAETVRSLRMLHEAELANVDDTATLLTALATFDQSVFELAGNKTIAVLSSIFRDIVTDQAMLLGTRAGAAPILAKLVDLHGEYVDAVARRDTEGARDVWSAYLSETGNLLARGASAAAFDVVPVWRAQGLDAASASTMAAIIATEIRVRIAQRKLRDGDQLAPMPELVTEFGVSRPTMREGLRILEMEGLVDLRTGSRSGATIREPTTETAANLAGIVLAAAQTRMGDVDEARGLVEPPVMGLVAARIDRDALVGLFERLQALKGIVDNTPAFIASYEDLFLDAIAMGNHPAVSVAVEILHWVTIQTRTDLTITALSLPQVIRTNRLVCDAFEEFINAAERGDVEAAAHAWARAKDSTAGFFQSSLGDRLIVDLFD